MHGRLSPSHTPTTSPDKGPLSASTQRRKNSPQRKIKSMLTALRGLPRRPPGSSTRQGQAHAMNPYPSGATRFGRENQPQPQLYLTVNELDFSL